MQRGKVAGNSEEADDLKRGLYLASEGASLRIQVSVSHNYRLLYMSLTSYSAKGSLICSRRYKVVLDLWSSTY